MKILDIEVEELIKMVCTNDINHIKLQDGKVSVEISRNLTTGQPAFSAGPSPVQPLPFDSGTSPSPEALNNSSNESEGGLFEVKSPLVGTFYQAPSPEEDPFVQPGDTVKKGDTLCIVEAMKSMNEIKAEKSGKILEVCLDDAEVVEYNQTLFKIKI